ncbi:hypothetical protein O181_108383 [Austropuccinia psidii MF-1]|uniref:Uncharacterized protein n=1 Tax=Austropuccinia psidii MF-1 TaxID=1389203 RepID=A0A9Q3PNT0_9BASI|nr:hypothetical protein [Austropuccinia psidii MF-1]
MYAWQVIWGIALESGLFDGQSKFYATSHNQVFLGGRLPWKANSQNLACAIAYYGKMTTCGDMNYHIAIEHDITKCKRPAKPKIARER